MYHRRIAPLALAGLGTFFAFSACSDVVEPERIPVPEASAASLGHSLIQCPTNEGKAATGVLDASGGVIRLDHHELRLPVAAITAPTPFEVREPTSNHMEIRVRADDSDAYQFMSPATITIDYSRCTRSNIDKTPLAVWQIDPETKALLEYMGGIDDKVARTVTFQTEHLSTFSIAR